MKQRIEFTNVVCNTASTTAQGLKPYRLFQGRFKDNKYVAGSFIEITGGRTEFMTAIHVYWMNNTDFKRVSHALETINEVRNKIVQQLVLTDEMMHTLMYSILP